MKEEKAIDSKLLDSTIIVDYFVHGTCKNIIESEENLLISTLSLFETKKKLIEKKILAEEINQKINFIKERTISLPVTDEISEKAANISVDNKIPALDSLIYATALINHAILYTLDNDFRGLPSAFVLDK